MLLVHVGVRVCVWVCVFVEGSTRVCVCELGSLDSWFWDQEGGRVGGGNG